jgi:photosystem II stability/assembly factor-like uncharacterized protein
MHRIIALVAAAVVPLFISPAAASTPARPLPANLSTIHMTTALVGWATNQKDVLHTADGGRTWLKATPSFPRGHTGYSTDFLSLDVVDARTAWLAAPNGLGSNGRTGVSLFHTTNAGRTWRRFPALPVGAFDNLGDLQFVDRAHGWLVVVRDVGMSQLHFDIYRTVNGGVRWQRVLSDKRNGLNSTSGGLPSCDCGQSFTYVSRTAGWAAGCYCGLVPTRQLFYRTLDGGRYWRPYRLPLPLAHRGSTIGTDAPRFFTRSVAVLPVTLLRIRSGMSFLFDAYHTNNGGRTWHGTTPIKVSSYLDHVQFVDPSHGFVLDGRRLIRTSDGGRHWQSLPTSLSGFNGSEPDFVSPTVGFATKPIGTSNRTRLLRTTDGGRTWKSVQAYLGQR